MSKFFDSKYQEARNISKVRLTKKQKKSLGITDDIPIILTQEQAATLLDITHATLSAWETDPTRHPRIDKVKIMSELYDCDIDYLVGIQNEKKKTYKHASEETGLSYKAIETLKEDQEICKIVSDLLESKKILMLIKEAKKADTIAKRGIAKDDMIKEKELRELKTWEAIRQYIGD